MDHRKKTSGLYSNDLQQWYQDRTFSSTVSEKLNSHMENNDIEVLFYVAYEN
jgi:hypothetical protein